MNNHYYKNKIQTADVMHINCTAIWILFPKLCLICSHIHYDTISDATTPSHQVIFRLPAMTNNVNLYCRNGSSYFLSFCAGEDFHPTIHKTFQQMLFHCVLVVCHRCWTLTITQCTCIRSGKRQCKKTTVIKTTLLLNTHKPQNDLL